MKKLLILIFFLITSLGVKAQMGFFYEDDWMMSSAVGFGNPYFQEGSSKVTLPPLSITIDHATSTNDGTFGIGGYLGFAKTEYRNPVIGRYGDSNSSHLIIGGRLSYSYTIVDRFDFLVGFLAGYDLVRTKDLNESENSSLNLAGSGGVFTLYLGGRYQVRDNLAAFVELGYGLSIVRTGVSFRIFQ